ncbi:Phytochromobilin:ferredoxin oxidoreductase, chloroplastic-like protein [Drosera capensis]
MCSSGFSFSVALNSSSSWSNTRSFVCKERNNKFGIGAAPSYHKFVEFALDEIKQRTPIRSLNLEDKFAYTSVINGKTELNLLSYEAPKIRLLRSMWIDGNEAMQVLDFAVFPDVAYDLPIFCANFFTSSVKNIIVLDLNPLHDVIGNQQHREKYYKTLMPLVPKYEELLPWGGKITSESLKFFSPIVIWTRFRSSQAHHEALFEAFKDFYEAWLELMEHAKVETDASKILQNREAQHRYLSWRTQKDPGHQMLKQLIGEDQAKDLLRNFLFKGVDELGSKTFLDYFPEYRLVDGTVNEKRSIIGKSFERRPWSQTGDFIGDNLE